MNELQTIENRILELHKNGISIPDISSRFGRSYSSRKVAGIIAKSEMTIQTEKFIIVPSKMNYEFKIIRDYEPNDT